MTETGTTCPTCQQTVSSGDEFCEACGTDLVPGATRAATGEPADPPAPAAAPCPSCGGSFADDGYCGTCGAKAVKPRDHYTEQPAPWLAGCCDRGVRHHRNEDAMALHAGPGHAVLVVCDGVSSSTDSDVASLAAARVARDVLATSRAKGVGTEAALVAAITARIATAADAASDKVAANTDLAAGGNPPSCTFVAGVVEGDLLVVGSVGDSRAYWVPDDGEAVALTVDDSFAAEQIAAGTPRKEAETGPQAHAITRWLGVDAPDHTPRGTTLRLDRPGWVLLCSDGLWNYCSEATELGALVRTTAAEHDADPLAIANALVDWANAQGGQDNITAALARFTPTR